jgi:hypothetical protein
MIRIREAAVAGSFYPADPGELQSTVQRLLDAVPTAIELAANLVPRALIVPHAGYVYSGPVAATAYARLQRHRQSFRRVVLLGPCHHIPLSGMAASSADVFRTPLGDVQLDHVPLGMLHRSDLQVSDRAHGPEHSLEVQLPFLQTVLESFRLVPLLVGDAQAEDVADVIDALWEGPDTLLVISSDLSHYLLYEQARRLDRDTCRAVEELNGGQIGHEEACGATPLRGLLLVARRRGLRPVTLDLRNSGDTSGSRDRVVGYGAWMFVEDAPCAQVA